MKISVISWVVLCLLLFAGLGLCQEALPAAGKTTLKLVSGDTMTGTVGSVRDGSVSLVTEFGTVRVPVAKLSEETKAKLGITGNVDVESLKTRIRELEDLVTRLREENASLRQAAAAKPAALPAAATGGSGIRPAPPAADGGGYKLSSTGKRHNSRCRYFGSAGRACSASEGVACKICGG